MHRSPRPLSVLPVAAAVALALTACTGGSDAAPVTTTSTPSTTVAVVPTTLAPTTVAPTTVPPTTGLPTTVAPTTVPSTSVPPTTGVPLAPGQELVFSMTADGLTFSIVTDATAATAIWRVVPVDGAASPRWTSVVPWVDEPNASGHRPLDGLDTPGQGDVPDEVAAANRRLVDDYVRTALVEGRWDDVDRFFRDGEYVLHGPLFADGLESVRSFFVGLRDAGVPFLISDTALLLAAGDHVLAINRHDANGVVTAYWDLWRIDDGAIAEHWDAITDIPADVADAWFAGAAA